MRLLTSSSFLIFLLLNYSYNMASRSNVLTWGCWIIHCERGRNCVSLTRHISSNTMAYHSLVMIYIIPTRNTFLLPFQTKAFIFSRILQRIFQYNNRNRVEKQIYFPGVKYLLNGQIELKRNWSSKGEEPWSKRFCVRDRNNKFYEGLLWTFCHNSSPKIPPIKRRGGSIFSFPCRKMY